MPPLPQTAAAATVLLARTRRENICTVTTWDRGLARLRSPIVPVSMLILPYELEDRCCCCLRLPTSFGRRNEAAGQLPAVYPSLCVCVCA